MDVRGYKPFGDMGAGMRRVLAFSLLVFLLPLIAVGCGGGSDDSSSGDSSNESSTTNSAALTKAQDAVAAARKVPKFVPPGPAFDATKAEGKKVMFLSVMLTVPAQQFEWEGTEAAAEAAGVEAVKYDAKGTTAGAVEGIGQAIAQDVDALIIDAVPSGTISAQIKKAQDAGIKVIVTQERNEEAGGPEIDTGNGTVAFPFITAADLEASWVIADADGGPINAVTFSVPGDLAHGDMVKTINDTLNGSGGDVNVDNQYVLSTNWEARLPVLVRSLMTKDPSINYFIPVVDGQTLYIAPALRQLGKQEDVKIVGFNGTPAVMSMLQNGEIQGADIGASFVWQGWANMDQALRALTGQPPAKDSGAPARLFDADNIDSIDVDAPEEGAEWYGTEAAVDGFKKLWGLG